MRIYLHAFERNSRPSKPASVSNARMPLIQIGDSTHHHDQVMIPVSLSAMNVISAIQPMSPGIFRCRAFRVGSFTRIMLNTLPGYGAGLELRYGGLAVNDAILSLGRWEGRARIRVITVPSARNAMQAGSSTQATLAV
jgi:hypothetical protein